jgi:hypothetical protein
MTTGRINQVACRAGTATQCTLPSRERKGEAHTSRARPAAPPTERPSDAGEAPRKSQMPSSRPRQRRRRWLQHVRAQLVMCGVARLQCTCVHRKRAAEYAAHVGKTREPRRRPERPLRPASTCWPHAARSAGRPFHTIPFALQSHRSPQPPAPDREGPEAGADTSARARDAKMKSITHRLRPRNKAMLCRVIHRSFSPTKRAKAATDARCTRRFAPDACE